MSTIVQGLTATAAPSARRGPPRRQVTVGVLSTFPPTQCGLATFSAALVEALDGRVAAGVVRVLEQPEPRQGGPVVAHLVNGSARSAAAAAARLDEFDAVVVQHEYGIYGGPDGSAVLDIVARLTVPLVVVTHTVLQEPTPRQRQILLALLDAADTVVTMTATARHRLVTEYGAAPEDVVVVPHGAIDHGRRPAGARRRGAGDRPLILTWGLLGPGKGIEWAIDALPGLRDLQPRYLVAGRTHPKVAERDGERYRDGLADRAAALGVSGLLELDDRYLTVTELADLVQQADVVLLPYDSLEQVTSGVLIEAVAAGRPVVSTAFPHAVELLGDGTGLVVPQRDAAPLEAALRRALTEPGLAGVLAGRAARKAPDLLWGAVADRYRTIVESLVAKAENVAQAVS